MERKINSASAVNATATQDHASSPVEPDLRRKLCNNGSCQRCAAGRSKGKDGSCAQTPGAKTVAQQPCAAGEIWGGTQCLIVGTQQCVPGQRVGTSCQAGCAIPTASAQNVSVQLRSARLRKNDICLQNPTGKECQEAEAHYDLMLNEYRNFLGGVPTECRTALPDRSRFRLWSKAVHNAGCKSALKMSSSTNNSSVFKAQFAVALQKKTQ